MLANPIYAGVSIKSRGPSPTYGIKMPRNRDDNILSDKLLEPLFLILPPLLKIEAATRIEIDLVVQQQQRNLRDGEFEVCSHSHAARIDLGEKPTDWPRDAPDPTQSAGRSSSWTNWETSNLNGLEFWLKGVIYP
jgi:hypothetical protein